MTPLHFLLAIGSGAVAGLLGGLFGIGGGIFLVPVLSLGFGLPMHQAIAASIVAVIATSSATASVYVEKGMSNIRLGMSLEVMTTIGAVLGGLAANALAGETLRRIFGIFLLCMAVLMWWRSRTKGEGSIRYDPTAAISGSYYDEAAKRTVEYSVRKLGAGMLVSFFAGNMSGLLGVGGGIIKVPVMNMVCGVPIKASTATSNLMIGVTAVASASIFFLHGNVHPYYTSAAVLGVLGGSRLGTIIGTKIRGATLMALFVAVLFITALRMLF
jgi:uncharacterized membrane protein YfcA